MPKEDFKMAKKDKNKEKAVQVNAVPAQGQPQPGLPRPARRPSKPLQLNPIIQPIAFVPYSTQQQELYMWEEEQQYDGGPYYDAQAQAASAAYDVAAPAYGDSSYQASAGAYDQGYYGGYGYQDYGYGYAQAPVASVETKKKKKVSAAAIILIILSLLSIALIVVGKFLNQSFLLMAGETSGLDMIINFFNDMTAGAEFGEAMIMPIAVLVVAVGAVIVLLGSLFGLFKKGATVFAKLGACLAFIGALVGLVVGLIKADTVQIQIGFYILVGIAALTLIIAFAAKNAPKAKK